MRYLKGGDGALDYGLPEDDWKSSRPNSTTDTNIYAISAAPSVIDLTGDGDYVCTTNYDLKKSGATNGLRTASGRVNTTFDFNSTQPLPWQKKVKSPKPAPKVTFVVRKFARCDDRELLAYLALRNVSTSFLHEIDQFLEDHPEIATCPSGITMIRLMNTMSALDAYRYFLRGYTRPARYVDGIVTSSDFRFSFGFQPISLRQKRDPELDEFFAGFEYRWDIIDRIDNEVALACAELGSGNFVGSSLKRLVCYAVFGNPIDAYKWYEYNIQQEYLPHTYLPEHVVLNEIPKPTDYTTPITSGTSPKHYMVRSRMARVNDEGMADVLDVLLSEYKQALVRRGYRRREIEDLCARALNRLDNERKSPTGVDIVDLLMDDAVSRARAIRPSGIRRIQRRGHGRVTTRVRTTTRAPATRQPPSFLSTQIAELHEAKRTLERLYALEESVMRGVLARSGQDNVAISTGRGTAERRYVNALVRYMRDSNRMSRPDAADMQKRFTRKRMVGMGPNKHYLIGRYPRELA